MKFKKKSIIASVAVLGSVLLLSGCGAHSKTSQQSSMNNPKTVKLGGPGIKKSNRGIFDQASSGDGVSSNDILRITKHHLKAQTGATISKKTVQLEQKAINSIPNKAKRKQEKAQFFLRLQTVKAQVKLLNVNHFDFYVNKTQHAKNELILHGHFVKSRTNKDFYARRGNETTFPIRIGKNGKTALLDPETKNKQTIISRNEMTANGQSYLAKRMSSNKARHALKSDKVSSKYINLFLK